MKRLELDHAKLKKRNEQLQKEKDAGIHIIVNTSFRSLHLFE
jgi:hypothetical protein